MSSHGAWLRAAVVLIAAWVCVGTAAAGPVQVTLQAKGKRADDTKSSAQKVGDTRYVQQTMLYSESGTSAMNLIINVRNMGREPQTLQLNWYFIGKPLEPKLSDFIADKGSTNLTIAAAGALTHEVTSKPLKLNKQTGHDVKVREGAEVAGYLVTLKSADTIVAIDASSPSLRKILSDSKKWKELLEAEPITVDKKK